jgi:hypothetical protein
VLGSSGYPKAVAAYAWDALPDDLNVSDYEVIVLDITALATEDFQDETASPRLPERAQLGRAIFGGSTVIAIGEPWQVLTAHQGAYDWLPVLPGYVREHGATVNVVADGLEGYFDGVRRTTHYYTKTIDVDEGAAARFLAEVDPQMSDLSVTLHPLAETRFGKPVAVSLSFLAWRGRERHSSDEPCKSGPVFLVPPSTERSAHQAVAWWLTTIGIAAEHEPPTWAASYVLPDELPMLKRGHELRRQLEETEDAIAELATRQANAGRWRALLYESGDALEFVVRDALAALGAAVSEPAAAGGEDGRLTDPTGREAVLEIKGLGKGIKLDHVRQLHQWVADALAKDSLDAKGLLIANVWAGEPPGQRGELVAAATLGVAERWQQALLTTTQLFAALVADQQGTLDRAHFWSTLFECDGLVTLPDTIAAVGGDDHRSPDPQAR